jgi:hypothetical protein
MLDAGYGMGSGALVNVDLAKVDVDMPYGMHAHMDWLASASHAVGLSWSAPTCTAELCCHEIRYDMCVGNTHK